MPVRGVRGATTVEVNRREEILEATRTLLQAMVAANQINIEDLASAFFTVTPDLDAAFPAEAARQLGWRYVPMLDACEIPVPGSLKRCIRVLLWWNTDRPANQIRHIYQGEARALRPDLESMEMEKESSDDHHYA